MKTLLSPRLGALLLFPGVVLLLGCTRPTGSVTGKVTYNNKALKGGSVIFVSDEGNQSFSAEIGEDGTYSVPKMIGGAYKVCVDTSYLKPATSGSSYAGMTNPNSSTKTPSKTGPPKGAVVPEGYTPSNPAEAAAAKSAKRYVQIPDKYKDKNQTDLTYNFEGGSQTNDIDLK